IASIEWTCPECGHKNEATWSASPYIAVADDACDEMCEGENCGKFFEISFYND
ncbi:MAG: hypothetical protein GTO02_04140, partial [Candidatus Dadabacteria bacterium]|nr:hypothetical protein [Candidatus Dadabacteria bacterium]